MISTNGISTLGLVTGGFDPVHAGHILMIEEARKRCDRLFVGINDDAWLIRKKGYRLLPLYHRLAVMGAIHGVHEAFGFVSEDGTAAAALLRVRREIKEYWETPGTELVFFQGGDREPETIPQIERDLCDRMEFGVGGRDKAGSSSDFFLDAMKNLDPIGKVS
jgi:cytidyltransferase-like protein